MAVAAVDLLRHDNRLRARRNCERKTTTLAKVEWRADVCQALRTMQPRPARRMCRQYKYAGSYLDRIHKKQEGRRVRRRARAASTAIVTLLIVLVVIMPIATVFISGSTAWGCAHESVVGAIVGIMLEGALWSRGR